MTLVAGKENEANCQCDQLKHRVYNLEDKIKHLRVSRRVLMNLVEKIENEKKELLEELAKETRKKNFRIT